MKINKSPLISLSEIHLASLWSTGNTSEFLKNIRLFTQFLRKIILICSVFVVSSLEPRHFHTIFMGVLKFPDTEICYLISSINNTIIAFLLDFI